MFDGLNMGLGTIQKIADAETRSITAENVYGEKGKGGMAEPFQCQEEVKKIGQAWNECAAARDLGRPWKVRPCITLPANSTTTLMDISGSGIIQHIWVTFHEKFYRDLIFRIYWDGLEHPSVETPLGDFFCNSWGARTKIASLPINVNPCGGFNCFFPMPFRKHVRITLQNLAPEKLEGFYYAINYALVQTGEDDAYFHAQFRRSNPLPYKEDYTILDGIRGRGQYVGTFMAWQQNSKGWWGEGEIKVFLDGDKDYPTICGTGTEDYFGGAWCFQDNFSAPFMGYPMGSCDGKPGNRHLLYRFHIMDPIRFKKDLRVTMQAIGWRSEGRYLPLQDDIASVAYWYQTLPHNPFPPLPGRDELEII
ncbi:MAG TPA: DUF2961 domain-containing protein [Candidatus Sumerlaeota bacterium]|nr:MAG: hypothetical protein BWY12_00799 [candidate division BRC1 bacterium ADurb.Bin183]HOE63183.1 DUF2961 domain-containing protein [Candidatus Sumerlaeota bacterium]HRR31542.1 DUF2961 domain-containing protein [Candidatus Sumerlaeia bacterium]HON50541.1 DUF2961 domain-containing protein [Candidatus Sumerlaeota bacterium]HOR65363.1 DUF2961 domain-containing protein [Candidatus Sumerlaeota bacterium]